MLSSSPAPLFLSAVLWCVNHRSASAQVNGELTNYHLEWNMAIKCDWFGFESALSAFGFEYNRICPFFPSWLQKG